MDEKVILVDERDQEIGIAEKLEAHRTARLHRAFSIFVFNSEGKLLLQKRSKNKYHSGGLWTNTCCGHPRPGEILPEAAHRRLLQEMGIRCNLEKVFEFTYKVAVANDFYEHEYDHVFVGTFDGDPVAPSPYEVEDWKWIHFKDLREDVNKNPDHYSYWLRILLDDFMSKFPVFRNAQQSEKG